MEDNGCVYWGLRVEKRQGHNRGLTVHSIWFIASHWLGGHGVLRWSSPLWQEERREQKMYTLGFSGLVPEVPRWLVGWDLGVCVRVRSSFVAA